MTPSVKEALEALDTLADLMPTFRAHQRIATIRACLEAQAVEQEAAFRQGQRDGIDKSRDAQNVALSRLWNSTLVPGDIEVMLKEGPK